MCLKQFKEGAGIYPTLVIAVHSPHDAVETSLGEGEAFSPV